MPLLALALALAGLEACVEDEPEKSLSPLELGWADTDFGVDTEEDGFWDVFVFAVVKSDEKASFEAAGLAGPVRTLPPNELVLAGV